MIYWDKEDNKMFYCLVSGKDLVLSSMTDEEARKMMNLGETIDAECSAFGKCKKTTINGTVYYFDVPVKEEAPRTKKAEKKAEK